MEPDEIHLTFSGAEAGRVAGYAEAMMRYGKESDPHRALVLAALAITDSRQESLLVRLPLKVGEDTAMFSNPRRFFELSYLKGRLVILGGSVDAP